MLTNLALNDLADPVLHHRRLPSPHDEPALSDEDPVLQIAIPVVASLQENQGQFL
jgi:hypothetical protein